MKVKFLNLSNLKVSEQDLDVVAENLADNHDLIDLIRGNFGDNSSNLLGSYSRIIRELKRINELYENDKTKDINKEYIGKFEENYRNLENEIRQNNDNVGGEEWLCVL